MVQVWEVLDASETARKAYKHLLARPEAGREDAKNVICILLWLETILGIEVLAAVAAMALDEPSLAWVVTEASAVYSYIFFGYYALPEQLEHIPTIVSLCGGGRLVDFRFFKFHKDLVKRGVAVIRDTVAAIVFNDRLHALWREFEEDSESSEIEDPVPAPELTEPFVPRRRTPPEDTRTAFVAIADGHRLTSQDIKDYFEVRLGFGPCIEVINTERPRPGKTAKHAVIVFRSRHLMDEAMFKETAAFFRVDGNDIWLQRYQPPF